MFDYNYVVVDLETTIKAPSPHFGATPHHPDNWIVMLGYAWSDGRTGTVTQEGIKDFIKDLEYANAREFTVLVAHNLAFDLAYLLKHHDLHGLQYWDTQKFHYMQMNRLAIQPSLESVANAWKIPFKKDVEVKERFKAGIGSDEIDEDLLREYLEEDVRVTEQIFLQQKNYSLSINSDRPSKSDYYLRYIKQHMKAVEITTRMACEGIGFDVQAATEEYNKVLDSLELINKSLMESWSQYYPKDADTPFNPSSPSQIETLLWGGTVKISSQETVLDSQGNPVRYKTGKKAGEIKTKRVTKEVRVPKLVSDKTVKTFKSRGWEMKSGAHTLENVAKYDEGLGAKLAKEVRELRDQSKSVNTYYQPYIKHSIDGVIYPQYHHTVTATGRLSSSKPNMQNISGKGK